MKKPEIKSKIKLEAVFGLVLLVSLVAGGLYIFSVSEPSETAIATTAPTNDDQPNEDSQTDENSENSGSEPVPGTSGSGITFALPVLNPGSNFETFYGQEPVYDDVSAADSSDDVSETPSNSENTDDEQETDDDDSNDDDDSDSGEIQIIETDDGFILVDADGNEINLEDIPEDILHDLEDLFPDLFIGDDDSGLNDYPEADEEDLDPDDVEYGDDDGFADDDVGEETDDETSDDETQNETEDETDDETQGIDSGDDEIGEVIDVDPLDDLEEFPEDVPDDLPDDDWMEDWING